MTAGPGHDPILQDRLPHTPWSDAALARMPGMQPVTGPWIIVDEVYAAQMALRETLIRERPKTVIARLPGTAEAEAELLATVLAQLPDGFRNEGKHVRRPDGRAVSLDTAPPLETLGHLLQEDLLLLQPDKGEHVLSAGLLCFPASWTLAEKIGRPLRRIHAPVPDYTADVAARVQRLFDRLPVGRALWRANALGYRVADLFHPRPEAAPRETGGKIRFLRSERQTLMRLPRTGAILFAVHTWVVPLDRLSATQRAECPFG
ncbi:DUF3445 domain-containing protein [Jannaschia sp. S6380]|uniref:heme-dependent oxidative N-demethylase family protein n=1 Tax=Jannaschia sp. S6380 TaxID=2926408 RepID=UPI001FF4F4EF|nr:DUF3445 domain-containing protein [Jannaschia sp. S6380]MCK0166110.1 DUF3445 domain-containing protein [Jannaschia sp. S6380]